MGITEIQLWVKSSSGSRYWWKLRDNRFDLLRPMNDGTDYTAQHSFLLLAQPRAQLPATQALCDVVKMSDDFVHCGPSVRIIVDHIRNKRFHEAQAFPSRKKGILLKQHWRRYKDYKKNLPRGNTLG
jgi:hypothetical protein